MTEAELLREALLNARDTSPAMEAAAVTPDDDEDLPRGPTRALFVGKRPAEGNIYVMDIVCVDMTGAEFVLHSHDCQYHPIRVRRVKATGTNAPSVLALY
jgi:hypothetical protein